MPDTVSIELCRSKVPDGPYPGLRPFEPHEWSIFFGREVMAAEVIAKLGEQNLIIVHGASGCGKSSLVRAGILPALKSDHDLNRRDFRYSIIRPSQGPLEALASALLAQLGPANDKSPDESWLDRIAIDQNLVETIEQRLEGSCATFCLVVDQFEEIFRWAEERDRAEAEFLVEFMTAVAKRNAGNRNFFVLVTMRSDYLGQCAQFRDFAGVVNQCQYLLDNLDEFGILRAIHEPADRFGGSIDPPLADRLRFMAKDDMDALPILQHTLMRMYDALSDKEPGWKLGLHCLMQVSGDHGPLSEHAESIYQETVGDSTEGQEVLEWMFRALTDLDAGGRAIRRPCRPDELAAIARTDEATIQELVDAFARPGRNFLVIAASERGAREIDISHEALIRRWRRIGDNSVDADTGQRTGWLFREFQAGLIWKALAVFAARGETSLEPETTRQWLPFFDQIEGRSAWARRYFVDPLPGVESAEQPEWTKVMALIVGSKERLERDSRAWRRALTRYWSYLVIAAALLAAAAVWKGSDLYWKTEAAEKEAAAARQATVRAQGQNAASQKLRALAQLEAQVAKGQLAQARRESGRARVESDRARAESDRARAEMHQAKQRAADFQRSAEAAIAGARAALERAEREGQERLAAMEGQFLDYQRQLESLMEAYGRSIEDFALDVEDQNNSIQAQQPGAALPSDFRAQLRSLMADVGAPADRAQALADEIESLRAQYDLTTDRRLAAFVAAVALGTDGFTRFEEQLDFDSAAAIVANFPEIRGDEAAAFVHRPRELANRAYRPLDGGSFEGLSEYETGNTEPEDGWNYRGRGLIFMRGRSDYADIGRSLNQGFLAHPELVNDPRHQVRAALERWRRREGNERADTSNLLSIARRVVGVNDNGERIFALEARARQLIARALERAR